MICSILFYIQGVFIFFVYSFEPATYGKNYKYPEWAEIFGIFLSLSSMLWVPGKSAVRRKKKEYPNLVSAFWYMKIYIEGNKKY